MVLQLSNTKVRSHFMIFGDVVTFRSKVHKTGFDWVNSGRGTEKIATVKIALVREVSKPEHLKDYVHHSGFRSVKAWVKAIEALNKGQFPTGYLYRAIISFPVKKK